MRIEHHDGHAKRRDNTRKFGEEEHSAFNMHMTIDESRGQPASFQIAFLMSPVIFSRCAHADDTTISNRDIIRITFAAAHVNEPCITHHQSHSYLTARNSDTPLKSLHVASSSISIIHLLLTLHPN